MHGDTFSFGDFRLDARDRSLTRYGERCDIANRYFDALLLLLRERGTLVSKDRFHDEVWKGIPVTDEALTQCIRTLRKLLGDDASAPQFIETVPKHGYRFIAPVAVSDGADEPAVQGSETAPPLVANRREGPLLAVAGTGGAAIAGVIGGLFYGAAAAERPGMTGTGSISMVLVLTALTVLVAALGGAGVSTGIAVGRTLSKRAFVAPVIGGAIGGFVIGAVARLVGLDAFRILLGRAPGEMTGATEGLVLGASVGLAFSLGERIADLRLRIPVVAGIGAAGALAVVAAGGLLMGGSLDALARNFPGSRLDLSRLGSGFGEAGFGPLAQAATALLEGALFALCIVGAMTLARRIVAPNENPAPTLREA